MKTLKIWHGPMRTELTLPMPDGKLERELVNAFHATPPRVVADEVSPQALAVLNGKEINLDELNFFPSRKFPAIWHSNSKFIHLLRLRQQRQTAGVGGKNLKNGAISCPRKRTKK